MNKQISYEMVNLEASNMLKASSLCDKAVEVVKSFDGKVLNVRLARALSEALGVSVDVENDYYRFDISIRCKDDCRSFKENPNSDIGYAYYTIHRNISICHLGNIKTPVGERCIVNKRINAKVIIRDICKKKESLVNKHNELKDQLDSIDIKIKRIEELKDQLKGVYSSIPYEVKEWFKIKELR